MQQNTKQYNTIVKQSKRQENINTLRTNSYFVTAYTYAGRGVFWLKILWSNVQNATVPVGPIS